MARVTMNWCFQGITALLEFWFVFEGDISIMSRKFTEECAPVRLRKLMQTFDSEICSEVIAGMEIALGGEKNCQEDDVASRSVRCNFHTYLALIILRTCNLPNNVL